MERSWRGSQEPSGRGCKRGRASSPPTQDEITPVKAAGMKKVSSLNKKKKYKKKEEGHWTSEEGSSCAGGLKEDLVFGGVHGAGNGYGAGSKGRICHRKVGFSTEGK